MLKILLIFYFIGYINCLSLSMENSVEAIACSRNPELPYCRRHRVYGTKIITRQRRADKEKDETACRELRLEYRNTCTRDKLAMENNEFCAAYENVCFRIPNGEPDQPATRRPPSKLDSTITPDPSPSKRISTKNSEEEQIRVPSQPKKDYTEFCKEYKQRFLYVCPDPFRFGQKAAVFCPIYSERCNVPVPEKPILPTERPRTNPISEALTQRQRACTQYRSFAISYCNNPFALQSYNVREGCAKYRRWCTRRSG